MLKSMLFIRFKASMHASSLKHVKDKMFFLKKKKCFFLVISVEIILSENYSKKFNESLSFFYQCFLGYSA